MINSCLLVQVQQELARRSETCWATMPCWAWTQTARRRWMTRPSRLPSGKQPCESTQTTTR